jgi:hypothetical protein
VQAKPVAVTGEIHSRLLHSHYLSRVRIHIGYAAPQYRLIRKVRRRRDPLT